MTTPPVINGPDCVVCGEFIYREGGEVHGRRVCHPCVEVLKEQLVDPLDKDALVDDLIDELRFDIRDAVERAVRLVGR